MNNKTTTDIFKEMIVDYESDLGNAVDKDNLISLYQSMDSSKTEEIFKMLGGDKMYWCNKHRNGIISISPYEQINEFILTSDEEV